MFSDHSENIFSPYPLKDNMVASGKASYGVLPNKVLVVGHDRLDRDFTKEELFAILSTMNNGKSLGRMAYLLSFAKL